MASITLAFLFKLLSNTLLESAQKWREYQQTLILDGLYLDFFKEKKSPSIKTGF